MNSQKQIAQKKQILRAEMKKKRDGLTRKERERWSDGICQNLQELPDFKDAKTICFYYPLGSEANLLPLAKAALALGKKIAFPRVEGSKMEFYRVLSLQEFVEGAFHVMEPAGNEVVREQNMLVFVPGMVFDKNGGRMGYGKGYYDRYFARIAGCRKAGVCYNMQIITQAPCEDSDIRMDAVVTEQKIYLINK